MAKRTLLSLIALLCLITPGRGLAGENDFERGLSHLQAAEDQQALEAFRQALRSAEGPPAERAQIHMYLGITHYNLLQQEQAKDQFRTAFSLDPELALPEDTSPVIGEFVAEIKAELAAERVDVSDVSPPVEPAPSSPPPGEMIDFVPAHAREDRPSIARRFWPAWVSLGVGLAAGGTGIALGVMAKSREDESTDPSLPYPEALDKHEQAKDLALGANILFGVAGASAITAAVFFYLGSQDDGDDGQASATVTPLPGGALLQLQGLRW